MQKVVACLTAALLMACTACNNNKTYPVMGRMTYKGTPASDAVNEPPIMGVVQEDGFYSLSKGRLLANTPS